MPKLSLVVPVYNVEQYLYEAVQSIQAQTMTDYQVVLVNDGSTDSSLEIAARVCEHDSRFVLVDQPNSGPGPGGGRNGGLSTATGELIMFMDSDDVIRPSMFAEMSSLLDNPQLDMVTTSAERLSGVTLRRSTIHDLSHPVAQPSTTVAASPWLMFDSTPWNKMFRREFFDDIVGTWPAQQLYEDIVPMATSLLRARAVGVLDSTHYLWRHRSDGSSITQQRGSIDGDLAQIRQLRQADRVVRDYGDADAKTWLDWKAYTFDFIWMLRKFAVLDDKTGRTLLQAMAEAMDEIGTAVLPSLAEPLRACVNAVLGRDLLRARVLGARHRLSLVPDRRRYDTAAREPLLRATLISSRPHHDHQRLVTSSDVAAGPPEMELLARAPWADDETAATIAATEVRRRGTKLHATFDVGVDDLDYLDPGAACFVKLRAGGASGEIQRSVQDRVTSRLGRNPGSGPVRQIFEGSNAVLLGPPCAPYIDEIELTGDTLCFSGELGEHQTLDQLRITDANGVMDLGSVIIASGTRFTTSVSISSLSPTVNYFIAFTNSNNPGLPTPVNVTFDTLLNQAALERITMRSSVHGQAYFRCNTNDFRSIVGELRHRIPSRK